MEHGTRRDTIQVADASFVSNLTEFTIAERTLTVLHEAWAHVLVLDWSVNWRQFLLLIGLL
jgi:hypothetical protein